jgi:glycine cleavage system transcriptional repressor
MSGADPGRSSPGPSRTATSRWHDRQDLAVNELAVTAVGADRPGIVAAVAEVLHDRGGNVEDSAMTILGGHFAIVLLVTSPDSPPELHEALAPVGDRLGLTISVSDAGGTRTQAEATHLLSVYGADKPGILAGVTRALALEGANITDLETRVLGGGEEPVYAMVVELVVGEGGEGALATAIGEACETLGVDHTLRAIEAETY